MAVIFLLAILTWRSGHLKYITNAACFFNNTYRKEGMIILFLIVSLMAKNIPFDISECIDDRVTI